MNKLTDWEVGQMLIDFSDHLFECEEFSNSHPELFEKIQAMRREIGDELDKLGSHGFGIYNNKDRRPNEQANEPARE